MARKSLLLLPLLAAACTPQTSDFPALSTDQFRPVVITTPDTCGAAGFTNLVGAERSVLNGITLPSGARIIIGGSPVTQDLRPDRLNFVIDGNANISQLFCG